MKTTKNVDGFMRTIARLALTLCAATLLAGCDAASCAVALACAGTSNSDANPPAKPLVFEFPTDFVTPYIVSGASDDDLFVVAASSQSTSVHVTRPATGSIVDGGTLVAGDWSAGIVSNERPSHFVYALPGQWYRFGLRSGTTVAASAWGLEPYEICDSSAFSNASPGFVKSPLSYPDYAVPAHSWWFYETDPTGGDCTAEPTEYHGLRMDDSSGTSPRGVGADVEPLRAFYSSTGAISGFVARIGNSIAYLNANFANPVTLASNVSSIARAGSYARTASDIYVRYKDSGNTSRIDRITSDGVIHPHLFSTVAGTIRGGFSDDTVLYVRVALADGSTQLTRIPYDGSAQSVIYTSQPQDFITVLGVTSHAVILGTFLGSGGEVLSAVEKTTGSAVTSLTQTNGSFFFFSAPEVVGDRVVWTAYENPASSGLPTTTRVGISQDDGAVVEAHANSEWIADFNHTTNLAKAKAVPTSGEVLVHDYSSTDWSVTGDQGGTVAFYNFDLGTKTDNLMTVPGPALIFAPFEPVGLATYIDLQANQSDVLSFDLRVPSIQQLTNTLNADEGVPFER